MGARKIRGREVGEERVAELENVTNTVANATNFSSLATKIIV